MREANRFVEKRSAAEIADAANLVREALQLGSGRVKMPALLELALTEVLPEFEFLVIPDEDFHGAEGLTDLVRPVILMPERVYNELRQGDPRAQFTAAHELGHLIMHNGERIHYAFAEHADCETDPEWQADMFAAAFLMPETAFRACRTPQEAMERFGVGYYCVLKRARHLGHRFQKGEGKKGRS